MMKFDCIVSVKLTPIVDKVDIPAFGTSGVVLVAASHCKNPVSRWLSMEQYPF